MPDTPSPSPAAPTPSPPEYARRHADTPSLPAARSDASPSALTEHTDDATQEVVAIAMLRRFHAEVEAARRFATQHYEQLPRELAHAWDAWVRGYSLALQQASQDPAMFGQLLGSLGRYQMELETYRRYFAHHLGSRPAAASAGQGGESEGDASKLSPWMIGGAGAALGLLAGVLLSGGKQG